MNFFSRIFGRGMGGLTCQQVEAVMQQYLDQELEPSEVPKVLKHLEACKDCGLEAQLYQQIKTSLVAHQQSPDDESMDRIRALAQQLAAGGPDAFETAE